MCITAHGTSATVQETAASAEQALQGHLTLNLEHGEALPEPAALDCFAKGHGYTRSGLLARAAREHIKS
jgi:hypothetical protein